MKKLLFLYLFFIILFSCGVDKTSPKYITEQYLLALKDKNWEKAKTYCEKTAISNLNCSIEMGIDFGITEVKDIKCKVTDQRADCKFCCMNNDTNAVITLVKLKNEWKVAGVKETCPLYDSASLSSYLRSKEIMDSWDEER